MEALDPYQRPPDGIRNVYKKYQKMKPKDLDQDSEIFDVEGLGSIEQCNDLEIVKQLDLKQLTGIFDKFAEGRQLSVVSTSPISMYEHKRMPGLYIIPNLLPPEIQVLLLSRLLHRDLSNPSHLTNIHTHYNVAYPESYSSFFATPASSTEPVATPLDPSIHKPLNVSQLLNKKMRWTTLGGQYDWTLKRYPDVTPPAFPLDIKQLLESIFPPTKAEAAIVNLYSPGDTLSLHRDVAESCNTGLISISLGCDAIFIIGNDEADNINGTPLALRLKSGGAVYMSGQSRFAWHGVPQIVPDTCPSYLKDWPANGNGDGEYEEWRGWMAKKRINLNVRQMRES